MPVKAELHFQSIFASWQLYAEGALGTLGLVVCVIPLGFALAVALALARKIAPQPIPKLVTVYVEFLRNTPFIVQLFYVYFGLGSMGFPIPPLMGALLALMLNLSAYSTEIIRAGIDSIHRSQLEAGLSLSMTRVQLYRHVVIMPNTHRPMNSGNQPPSTVFSMAEEKKARSMATKTPVAKMHSHSGRPQA